MYSILVKTIYCYLKKGPCVRGFELYHGYFRVGIITTVQYLSNMHLLNGKLNVIRLAKKAGKKGQFDVVELLIQGL